MSTQHEWGNVGDILRNKGGDNEVVVGHNTVGPPETMPLHIFEDGKDAVIKYLGIELGERAWRLFSLVES